jgi:zinc transport system substrate-binding protein
MKIDATLKIFIIIVLIFFLVKPLYAQRIVVSNQAMEKIVKEVAWDHKIYKLQNEKEDFHFYEPTISQWQKIKTAGLVIIVGTETWAKRVYALRKGKKTLSLLKENEKISDPHLWFDLERVKRLAKDLGDYLSKKEPSKKEVYQKRVKKFIESLEKVQEEYKSLRSCKYKEIFILGHPVFGYLLKYSGIKEITLLRGYHKEGEPSIKTLADLYKRALESNKVVFLTDPEFERYKKFFEEKGIKVVKLWSGGTYHMPGSYVELLEYNLKNIKKALICK